MWSRKYERCQECGTTERQHYGKGLCYQCYNRAKYKQNPEPQKSRSSQYYEGHREAKCAYQAEYYQLNRDEQLEYRRMYREEMHFSGMRTQILDRDGHCCTTPNCGATEDLIVHHKDGKGRGSRNPNNDQGNLVTLCRACHVRVHLPRLGTGRMKI